MRALDRDASVTSQRVSLVNRIVLRLLGSRMRHLVGENMTALRYDARSGTVVLPVQAARSGGEFVVMSGAAANKRWWRHFKGGASVEILLDGQWRAATGRVVAAAADGVGAADAVSAAYQQAFPRTRVTADSAFVVVTPDAPLATAGLSLRGASLVRTWFWMVTPAEFAGFSVPALVGAVTVMAPPAISVPALLAAGGLEGCMLGWGQVTVLRRALPGVPRRPWIAVTAVAAMLAYAIGLLPSTLAGSIGSWPRILVVAGAVVAGAALLASIGTAQWFILRRHVAHSSSWIASTALAWLVGLAVFLGFSMPLWQAGQPVALTVGIGVVGGLLMAATTSLITGVALRRLLS